MSLNEKQKRFCQEYVIDLNGRRAAIAAGYSSNGAEVHASRLLTKANIQAYVQELRGGQMEKAELSAEKVIDELKSLGFWNIQDFIGENNTINDLSKMDRKVLRPVVGIKVTETYLPGDIKEVKTELKLADKRAALVDLGRHLGIFKKDNEQKDNSANVQLSDAQFDQLLNVARAASTSKGQ